MNAISNAMHIWLFLDLCQMLNHVWDFAGCLLHSVSLLAVCLIAWRLASSFLPSVVAGGLLACCLSFCCCFNLWCHCRYCRCVILLPTLSYTCPCIGTNNREWCCNLVSTQMSDMLKDSAQSYGLEQGQAGDSLLPWLCICFVDLVFAMLLSACCFASIHHATQL